MQSHAIILSGPRPLCACGQLVCDHLCRPTRGGSAWLTVPLGAFGLARGVHGLLHSRLSGEGDGEKGPELLRGGVDPEPSKAAVTVVSELGPFRYVLIFQIPGVPPTSPLTKAIIFPSGEKTGLRPLPRYFFPEPSRYIIHHHAVTRRDVRGVAKILMDAMESAKTSRSKDTFLELKYEDLCSDPLDTFRTVTEFCEFTWTAEFEKRSESLSCPSQTPFTKPDRLTLVGSRRRGNVGYSCLPRRQVPARYLLKLLYFDPEAQSQLVGQLRV
jgi:hypothetical protein